MQHPVMVKSLSQARYQEMLQDAANARRCCHNRTNHLQKLGTMLIQAGQKLQGQDTINGSQPALQLK